MTEAWVTDMISKACKQSATELAERIEMKVDDLVGAFDLSSGIGGCECSADAAGSNAQQQSFPLGVDDGRTSRLPADFQFPKSTACDLWVQWNASNSERKMPALRSLDGNDFLFMDEMGKSVGKTRGGTGKHKEK